MLVETPDARIHLELYGTGDGLPLLLIHGLGGAVESWGTLPAAIAGHERTVGALDLRGCGTSERGKRPISLAQLADDCAGVIRTVWHSRCHLLGHSLGGVIVQDLLVRYPALCGAAVLVSTSSKVGERAAESWRRLADVVERNGLSENGGQRSFSDAFAAANPAIVSAHARIGAATDPMVYASQARAASSYDYGELLRTVTNPVLVIQGGDDRLTSPGGSVILSRALPNAELQILPGIGHNAHIELGARFVELVQAFLSRYDGAPPG